MHQLTEPASREALAVALDKLLAFARAFNVAVIGVAEVIAIYRDALSDIPSDLIVDAVNRAVRTWSWGNRLPMPADLRKFVEPELFARTAALSRHKVALMYARDREALAARRAQPIVPFNLPPLPGRIARPRRVVREPTDGAGEVELGNVDANLERWSAAAGEGEV